MNGRIKKPYRLIAAVSLVLILAAAPTPAGEGGAADPGSRTDVATFAGGCFWCMEADFEKIEGVISATSGYTGGDVPYPTYKEVSAGGTGHAESIRVDFDPSRVSYAELLEASWHGIDPTMADRQFCDVGDQYRSAIFVHDAAQRAAAEGSRAELERTKVLAAPIVTEITEASTFYPAEEYHQDYAKNHPLKYRYYRRGCGRDRRLEELWGDKK